MRNALRRHQLVTAAACGALALALAGCSGEDKNGATTPAAAPAPSGAPTPAAPPAAAPAPAGPPPYFAVPTQAPQLLPFTTRLARVAAVAGVPTTDPLLASLVANRAVLGDHDFANSVKPDTTWTALRMATWVKAVQPVCQSEAMLRRYPALPANLSQLFEAAYGRTATQRDIDDVNASLVGLNGLTAATRYQALCVAVLSSMEFVAH